MDVTAKVLVRRFNLQEDVLNQYDIRRAIHKVHKLVPKIELVQATSEEVFMKDISIYLKENIPYRLWKTTLYRYVAAGREIIQKYPEEKPDVAKSVEVLIEKTMDYFKKILAHIDTTCVTTEDKYTGHAIFEKLGELPNDSYLDSAKECYSSILTLMGDTTRYSYVKTGIIRQGMILYDRARLTAPDRGRPYRQMGVVSGLQWDWLGGAYYLTRAKLAKEPEEVREDLLDIYDEACKEYRRVGPEYWYKKAKEHGRDRTRYGRKLRWIYTLGHGVVPEALADPQDKDAHFKTLSDQDILRRFMLSYVHFIGKLYTRIDVDEINIVAEDALIYFEGMIKRWKGATFPASRIVQIVALNMFIVKLTKDKTKLIPKSAYLETTVMNFVMEMFSVMCEKMAQIIFLCDWKNTMLDALSIGIHLWLEWMSLHPSDWKHRRPRAPFSARHVLTRKFTFSGNRDDDVWIEFANLMTRLEIVVTHFSSTLFPLVSEEISTKTSVKICPLPECTILVGFPEFKAATIGSKQYYTSDLASGKRAQIIVRLKSIHEIGASIVKKGKMIETSDGPYNCKVYKSVVRTLRAREQKEIGGVGEDSLQFYAPWNNKSDTLSSLSTLSKRKIQSPLVRRPDCNNGRVMLRNKSEKKVGIQLDAKGEMILPVTKCMRKFESWLYHTNRGYTMEILIEPMRLVIDTNCFVRHMEWVQRLLKIHPYQLYIPVSVVLELKGLSRGGPSRKDAPFANAGKFHILRERIATSYEVAKKCRLALAFIQTHLDYFKIVTSTGRILRLKKIRDRISDDYFDPHFSNDERIVDTCRYLEGDDVKARAKDCLSRVYRKTVVVTSDRNLRIKARSYELPGVPIHSLVLWLNAVMMTRAQFNRVMWQEHLLFRRNIKVFRDMRRRKREEKKLARSLESGKFNQHSYNKNMLKRRMSF